MSERFSRRGFHAGRFDDNSLSPRKMRQVLIYLLERKSCRRTTHAQEESFLYAQKNEAGSNVTVATKVKTMKVVFLNKKGHKENSRKKFSIERNKKGA
jgi:hypothetical protein